MSTPTTNNLQPARDGDQLVGQVRFGLITVHVRLQLRDAPNNATAVARSALSASQRVIHLLLYQNHLMVSRALLHADVLTIKFLIGLSLSEFCAFWGNSSDGASVTRGLKKIAGFQPHERAYGSAFASKLAISEPMRTVDGLPIFSRTPQSSGPFDLFVVTIEGRSPSDIRNWVVRDERTEAVRPIPKPPPRPKPEPVAVLPAPDPFLSAFHARAQELLAAEDYATIKELALQKEVDLGRSTTNQ